VGAVSRSRAGLLTQIGAILATGNFAVLVNGQELPVLPAEFGSHVAVADRLEDVSDLRAILFEGGREELVALSRLVAEREGAIVPILAGDEDELIRLLEEVSIATNTAAAGGNASLMALREDN
jgi:RHH-type proline utilization regulon transcriptional repressor/proline dehydrogenase/delta 1-pyrroline-5-carboxylate dehydrogenase